LVKFRSYDFMAEYKLILLVSVG